MKIRRIGNDRLQCKISMEELKESGIDISHINSPNEQKKLFSLSIKILESIKWTAENNRSGMQKVNVHISIEGDREVLFDFIREDAEESALVPETKHAESVLNVNIGTITVSFCDIDSAVKACRLIKKDESTASSMFYKDNGKYILTVDAREGAGARIMDILIEYNASVVEHAEARIEHADAIIASDAIEILAQL